jgi:GTP cyclohydrolase II
MTISATEIDGFADGSDAVGVRAEVPIVISRRGAPVPAAMISFTGVRDGREHIAIRLGEEPFLPRPLVRIHSECLTGDIFGSLRCDCGPQLTEAVERIADVGGYVLYLRQEGRGIGLYNKLDAYGLQDIGFDTFTANRMLGLAGDLRSFSVAADILRALGHDEVELLSNNPEKRRQLEEAGITVVEQQPTGVFLNAYNSRDLRDKRRLARHSIALTHAER